MKNQWIQASKYLWRTLIHEFEETNNTHPHTHTKFAKLKSFFFFFFVDNMQNPILKKVMLCTIIRTNPVAKEHKIYNKKLKKKKNQIYMNINLKQSIKKTHMRLL